MLAFGRQDGHFNHGDVGEQLKRNAAQEFEAHGEVLEYDLPRVLVWSWTANWHAHPAHPITNTGKAASRNGSVQRIDPGTNRVVATIPVGPTPRFLAAGEGGLWTLDQGDGSVSRFDPSSNTVVATIAVGAEGAGGDIATGAGAVWVRAGKVLFSMIRPDTNRVVERLGPPAGGGAVRVADNFVWVTAHDIQTV